ncbi:MAG: chloride channel protein [Candidatus Kapabacteria bacterium]|nr:chloride channel protein [Candidatus Kapabacteria bacterium]
MTTMMRKILYVTISLCISSVIIGLFSAWFLSTLEYTTTTFGKYPLLLWGLPIVGLLVGVIYDKFGKEANYGTNHIINSSREINTIIPFRMAPFVFFGTLLSHLVGASAGREGTAVQVGGVIGEQIRKWLNVDDSFKSLFLMCGIAAGFSSVFGLPFAGGVFAVELCFSKITKRWYLIPIFCCAVVSHWVCIQTGIHHLSLPTILIPTVTIHTIIYIVVVAIACLLVGFLFVYSTKQISSILTTSITYKPLHPFIGGIVLLIGYHLVGDMKFAGLGIETITNGFTLPQGNTDFFLKLLFTSITVGSGFKGGEVTPLFFIGVTMATFLLLFIPLPLSFMATLCFVGVFSAATKLPIASFVMGIELFGFEIGLYILIVTLVTGSIQKKQSIYA